MATTGLALACIFFFLGCDKKSLKKGDFLRLAPQKLTDYLLLLLVGGRGGGQIHKRNESARAFRFYGMCKSYTRCKMSVKRPQRYSDDARRDGRN